MFPAVCEKLQKFIGIYTYEFLLPLANAFDIRKA
jgi:hypothetical protein